MGVRYLLDTHVVLWLIGEPSRVPVAIRDRLADREAELLVSSVSAMEVATKTRLGKLVDVGLLADWSRRMSDIGALELDLTSGPAITAGTMGWEHRDPFDRLLAAQAIHERAVLVTVDSVFKGLPAPNILTW